MAQDEDLNIVWRIIGLAPGQHLFDMSYMLSISTKVHDETFNEGINHISKNGI